MFNGSQEEMELTGGVFKNGINFRCESEVIQIIGIAFT